jgi:hypothetical protein
MRKLGGLAPFGLLALGLVGCLKPDHIEMEPQSLTLNRRGDQVWVRAIFKDHQSRVYPKEHTVWASSDPKVATVDNKEKVGNVVATGPGSCTVTVKNDDGLEAELPVTVATVEKIKVAVATVELELVDGENPHVPLVAQGLDVNGKWLKDRKPHYKCLNEKICNSDGDNIWAAGDPGESEIEVSVDDLMVKIPVVVTKGKKR